MTLTVVPVSLAQANTFIDRYHRHHGPLRFHKYSIGAIQTYTLADEAVKSRGASLWAAGWLFSHVSKGGTWNNVSRSRTDKHPIGDKFCWIKELS